MQWYTEGRSPFPFHLKDFVQVQAASSVLSPELRTLFSKSNRKKFLSRHSARLDSDYYRVAFFEFLCFDHDEAERRLGGEFLPHFITLRQRRAHNLTFVVGDIL